MAFVLSKNSNASLPFIQSTSGYNFFCDEKFVERLEFKDQSLIIIGDLINIELIVNHNGFSLDLLSKLKGVFTIIVFENNGFCLYQSYFSMLPIYMDANKTTFSNSTLHLVKFANLSTALDKGFILESFLFNYPLSNKTIFNDVFLLPSFHYVSANTEEISFVKHFDVQSLFPENPASGQKKMRAIAEKFIEECKPYFSAENNCITFTSGFDGRTIVSNAIKNGSKFYTVACGRKDNIDVVNPALNAKELGIDYEPYDLLSKAYGSDYGLMANDIFQIAPGYNAYLYPHFQYLAYKNKDKSNVLLTGYCGSELFRALHIQGAVTSKALVEIFLEPDEDMLKKSLKSSEAFKFLNFEAFENEFEELWQEIIALRDFNKSFKNTNHAFYHYVFTETFRKVFGTWTLAQFKYMKVRIPFLDFTFIKELLKTDIAGCNNEFFTHNPFKRMKGQYLYAEIIKLTSKKLYKLPTGKGYAPVDLNNMIGKLKITLPYIKKKFKKNLVTQDIDNLGLITQFNANINTSTLACNPSFFNSAQVKMMLENMHPRMNERHRDYIFLVASYTNLELSINSQNYSATDTAVIS
jgi:hypothetical protein